MKPVQGKRRLPCKSVVQDAEAILADSERLIDRYHERGDGAQIQIALAPCSPFPVTTGIMRTCAELAEARDVRLHTHLAETLDEQEFCAKRFGMRTVDYLQSVGWLAHAPGWPMASISTRWKFTACAGVGICHVPSSNMRLASGICHARRARGQRRHHRPGRGRFGLQRRLQHDARSASALFIQRLRYGAEKITPQKVLGWATRGSARLLRRSDIGELAVGKQADLALFKLDELRFSGSHDPIAALLLCARRPCRPGDGRR